MGNTEAHEDIPSGEGEEKVLNLSRKLNHSQYCKHSVGAYSESCHKEIPWSIRDSVSLYSVFDISFNCITEFPPEMPLRLPHLAYLDMSFNNITELPESFALLYHLQTVLIQHNQLRKLPQSFCRLHNLTKLDISHNKLTILPENIGTMKSLEKLNVSNNRLKTLPPTLGLSNDLNVLIATCNRLENPPQTICDLGSVETLSFLRDNLPSELKILPKVKTVPFQRVLGSHLHFSNPNPHSALMEYIQTQTNTAPTPNRVKTPLLPPAGGSALDPDILKDKIIGLIYGAAIGDGLGIATQNMTPDDCQFHYSASHLTFSSSVHDQYRSHWKHGEWTNNFDQMGLLLESLVHWAGVVDELDFARNLHKWSKSGLKDLGPIDTSTLPKSIAKVVIDARFQDDPHNVARQNSSSDDTDDVFTDNAALSRTQILGVPYFHDLNEVVANAERICKASHSEPLCVSAAVTLTVMVSLLLQGRHDIENAAELQDFLKTSKKYGLKYLSSTANSKEFGKYMSSTSFASVDINEAGHESFTLKPLGCAVAALHQQGDFRSIITDLLMQGGDSSCNACIAGGLLGCWMGYSQLPEPWITGLQAKRLEWLHLKSNLLLDMIGIP